MDLAGLNPPQREAVLHGDGPLVVFAGAGSGKTRVITHRIAHLIAERGVAPWRILAVTFTNKAAGEMRERLAALVGGGARGLQVGTFHATCARLLRRHVEYPGLQAQAVRRDFTIYDDQDQRAMVKRVMDELNLSTKQLPPKRVQGAINQAKQEVLGPDDVELGDPWREIVQRVYALYDEKMRAAGALDFGDLIYRLVVALEMDDALREELAGRFRYVLVDEFQDTNHAQFRLVKALGSVHGNLCVVGDDDQSIYRWRGADRRNILDFRSTWPGTRIIKLEQNYRSTQRILRVAHAVIRRNLEREPKQMWTENPEGDPVLVVRTEDERDEGRMVVRGAMELRQKGEPLREIAVFYRTHAQSRVIEEALRQANLPYRIVGGVRFYDRAEVKDLLAYLRVLHNPDDDVSLLRIINTPTRGIGKTTISRLLDDAAEAGTGVWGAVRDADESRRLGAGAKKKVRAFRELMEKLRDEAFHLPLADLGGAVLEDTGYLQVLKNDDSPEADARLENLQELVGSMQFFASEREEADLASFLEEVTLQSDVGEDDGGEEDKLTLMTVHAAKGLEFDTVMVTGLEEGMFPMRGTAPGEDPEELEEERRLAYVAFTRARRRLILSYAAVRRIYGQTRPGDPSRFLHEVPREDAKWIGAEVRSSRPSRRAYVPDPWDAPRRSPAEEAGLGPREAGESYIDYSEGSDFGGFTTGMMVRHPKFGVGQVRRVEMGMVPKAHVLFPGWGPKTLAVKYLEPV
ncbi:MAG: ATP-dependent DNA helicase PcrA [Sandaracinus sp.]|nr:ATP-dependent DNA helicase PcrA [Myxococcales bacterium]MAT23642.1 ATP-dependent DNA helicase PcrA [Sandaracinus sp.]